MTQLVPNLLALEKIIEKGKQSFIEVGQALASIKTLKLYKLEYKTFESYCQERWGWGKNYANRLIEAADVVKTVPMGTKITTERQARELSKVPKEERASVLEKAAAAGPVTARSIREAAAPTIDVESTVAPEPANPGVRTRDQEIDELSSSEAIQEIHRNAPPLDAVDIAQGWLGVIELQAQSFVEKHPEETVKIKTGLIAISNGL